jgi:hypothetical protein
MSSNRRIGAEVFVTATEANATLKETQGNVRGIGEAAQSSSSAATAAMNGVSSSANAQAAAVGATGQAAKGAAVSMAQLEQIYRNLVVSQGAESAAAQAVAAEMKATAGAVTQVSSVTKEQTAALRLQTVEQRLAAVTSQASTAAIREQQAALRLQMLEQKAVNVVNEEAVVANTAAGFSAGETAKAVRLMGAESKLLGGSLGVPVRPLSMLISGFGSLNPAMLASVVVFGLVGFVINKLSKDSEKQIAINKELIDSDVALANAFTRLAVAAGLTPGAIDKQAESYRKLIQIDLQTAFTNVEKSMNAVENKINALHQAEIQQEEDLRRQAELRKILRGEIDAHGQDLGRLQTQYETGQVRIDSYKDSQAALNGERQKAEDELRPHIQTLIRAAEAAHKNSDDLIGMARAAGMSRDAIAILGQQLSVTTRDANNLAEALANIKPPQFDIGGTLQGIRNSVVTAQRGFAATGIPSVSRTDGIATENDKLIVNKQNIEAVNQKLQDYARYHAQGATAAARSADAQRIYNEQLRALEPEMQKGIKQQQDAAEVTFNHAKAHHSGAAAARAYSNELINLRKAAEEAEAALLADSFAQRQARIEADIKAEREHLQINKRDREAALDELTRKYVAQSQKVRNDELEAERSLRREISRLAIQADQDERRRKQALLNFDLADAEREITQKFGMTQRAQILIDEKQRSLILAFNNWDEKESRAHWVRQRQAREEEERKFYLNQDKLAREARSNRPGRAAVEADVFAKQAADVDRVTRAFGFASRSEENFRRQLGALDRFNKGDFFGGLKASMHAIAEEMRQSQSAGEQWSDFLTSAVNQLGSNIESGFEGIINGTQTFGQLMKKLMFDLIASIAEQWGAYYLAIGIADLFWNPAQGAAELAAGAALLALAGVLHGLSGAAGNRASAASSSGGAAASGSPAASRPAIQPTTLSVPSGRNQSIQFDARDTKELVKRLLADNEVITVETASRNHQKPLKNAVGVK